MLVQEGTRRGYSFDFTGVRSKAKLQSPYHEALQNQLLRNNSLKGIKPIETNQEPLNLPSFHVPSFFEDKGTSLAWSSYYGQANHPQFLNYFRKPELKSFLFQTVFAHYWWDVFEGLESKPLVVSLNISESSNYNAFMDILSFLESLPSFKDYFSFEFNFLGRVDLNLELYRYESHLAGNVQEFSLEDKETQLSTLHYKEGMILTLFERKGLSKNNALGRIVAAHLVRFDGLKDGLLHFTPLSAQRTYEELAQEYQAIPLQNQEYFEDLLEPQEPTLPPISVRLQDCGLGTFSYREPYLLLPLSANPTKPRLVSLDGVPEVRDFLEYEFLYFTLLQRKLDFNQKLFVDYYFQGVQPSWYLSSLISSPKQFLFSESN